MALAYTAPTWTDGSGEGISASNLQAISDCIEGLVQGSDKAVHAITIDASGITLTYADGTQETFAISDLKGIASVAKISTVGLVDTYRITYTDSTYYDFSVTNGANSVSVESSGTASTTATHQQQVTVNGVSVDIAGTKYMESTANSASFVFSNAAITATSAIDVYTDTWGDNPSASGGVVASAGTCTVTFDSAQTRTVRIYIK